MGKIILTDKRGRPQSYQSLYEGSQPAFTPRRSQVLPIHTRDAKADMSPFNWRQLLSTARYLYANVGSVHGAINEIGTYSVGDAWRPRFTGANDKWGDKAEAWLNRWFEICDVRGQPYDFRTDLFLASVSVNRCGDLAMILAQTDDEFPMLQFLPAHRIGSRSNDATVKEGPYKGLEIYNGVITNAQGRPVAFNVLGNANDGSEDQQISARDMQLSFNPRWFDQGRGISALAHAIKDFGDYRDIRDFLKTGLKAEASLALIEHNETGSADVDAGAQHFDQPAEPTGANQYGVVHEELDGGAIRYFRANSGSNLTAINSRRPSTEAQSFIESQIMRGAYAGLEWPLEFSWNPERLGGANIRLIVGKAERTVANHQRLIGKTFIRAVTYGIAKAIKIGSLPFDPDWAMWDADLPPTLSVDAGYASKAEIAEYQAGFKTLSDVYGERGYDWQAKIRQRIRERKFLLDECAAAGIQPSEIQQLKASADQPAPTETEQD